MITPAALKEMSLATLDKLVEQWIVFIEKSLIRAAGEGRYSETIRIPSQTYIGITNILKSKGFEVDRLDSTPSPEAIINIKW